MGFTEGNEENEGASNRVYLIKGLLFTHSLSLLGQGSGYTFTYSCEMHGQLEEKKVVAVIAQGKDPFLPVLRFLRYLL